MIRILFGNQWDMAVPIASTLSIWAIFYTIHIFSSPALIAIGKEKLVFKKESIIFTIRLIGILIAAPYGLIYVAWSIVLIGMFEFLINSWFVRSTLNISFFRLLKSLYPSFFVTITCWLVLYIFSLAFSFKNDNPLLTLVLIGFAMLFTWTLSLYIVKHDAWNVMKGVLYNMSNFKKSFH
jgi:O-antigen/teichoic acid export membrane protein